MKVKLCEAFDLQMGKTPSRDEPSFWDGTHKWISIGDLTQVNKYIENTKECISDKGVTQSGIKIVPKNTVVMSFKLSIGKVAITAEDMYTNEAIMAFIDKGTYQIDPNYLYYLFTEMDWSEGTNKAVMGLTLNKATLSQKEISIPSIEHQMRVITVLDKITGLISLRKQQLAKLDELVKARFVEMFGNSKTNPRHWAEKELRTVANVGSSKRVFVNELQNSGVPFYRGTEIGALAAGDDVVPELFINPEHYRKLCDASGAPQRGDLLMPSICSDGRIWLVDTDAPFYFKDGRVLWVHPTDENIESTYLLYALKEKVITDYSNIASGTTFAELKIFSLKDIRIMVPPLELQQKFALFVQSADVQRLTTRQGLDKLEMLKRTLMQEYFEK